MSLEYAAAVKGKDEGNTSYRIVFKLGSGYVVYKFIADDVWTAKFWNTEDIDKTMSHWSTKTPFVPTDAQLEQAVARIQFAAGKMARIDPHDDTQPVVPETGHNGGEQNVQRKEL